MSQPAIDFLVRAPTSGAILTSRLHPQHRSRAWIDALASAFGTQQEAGLEGPASQGIGRNLSLSHVRGTIQFRRLLGLTISKVSANGHAFRLQTCHGPGTAGLSLYVVQTKGVTRFRNERASTVLARGDVALITARAQIEVSSALDFEYVILNWHEGVPWDNGNVLLRRDSLRSAIYFLVQRLAELALLPCDADYTTTAIDTTRRLLDVALRKSVSPSKDDEADSGILWRMVVKQYIEEHLHEANLSVEAIAIALDCSRRTIYRSFVTDGSDETISRYLWRRRVERCAEVLRCSDEGQTLTEISSSLGFSNSSQFSRTFKRYMGVSPLAFRRSFQRSTCAHDAAEH